MKLDADAGLRIDTLVLGEMMTNCYVLTCAEPAPAGSVGLAVEACWVVDPGLAPKPLLAFLRKKGLAPQRVLLTHGHGDHIAGVGQLKRAYPGAIVTAPEGDAKMLQDPIKNLSAAFGLDLTAPPADELVRPGEVLKMGALEWRVLDASGHTPGGVAYHCAAAGVVLTGDSLFAESIGRYDLPGADGAQLLRNIRGNLFTLPDGTRVLPGHGEPTTIAHEKRHNPFVGEDEK